MSLPSVFSYLDYRVFLIDWFNSRKQADPNYSYALFAKAGGCSKAALANVLSGARNPRPDTLDAFSRAMELPPIERNYLGLLVVLATAPDMTTRRNAMERILSTERNRQMRWAEHEDDSDVLRYLEHWYVPAIRELAAHPKFRADPEWIVATLRPRISVEEAESALETLFDLDYLRRTEDGRVEPRDVRFQTEPDAWQFAADHYHRTVIPGMLQDMDTTRHDDQHAVAATMLLPEALIPEAKARMNALVQQLAAESDDHGIEGPRRVYQLALQLFPISEPLG